MDFIERQMYGDVFKQATQFLDNVLIDSITLMALVRMLIEKGVITKEEVDETLKEALNPTPWADRKQDDKATAGISIRGGQDMSRRIVTIDLSMFTFEQLDDAYTQLAVIRRWSALVTDLGPHQAVVQRQSILLSELYEYLSVELERRVRLRNAVETQ